jgi:hypothetical protein
VWGLKKGFAVPYRADSFNANRFLPSNQQLKTIKKNGLFA